MRIQKKMREKRKKMRKKIFFHFKIYWRSKKAPFKCLFEISARKATPEIPPLQAEFLQIKRDFRRKLRFSQPHAKPTTFRGRTMSFLQENPAELRKKLHFAP